ncbi:MAG TPA: hypothetical protein VK610_09205 [Rhodothermales bacterium]|nr:hypothetical protein [Rhodothermales bacterium]
MADAFDVLPDVALDPGTPLGAAFAACDVRRFRDAARFVGALPYGRNGDRADFGLVLRERRGTCSTKHALLAALAEEHGAPVDLALGIYLMDEANTPGVGPTLAEAGLDAVPEAHCYLVAGGARLDLTWPGRAGAPPPVVWEEPLRPEGIGAYKVGRHRAFVATWSAERGLDADVVWAAREACIVALSTPAA